MHQKTCRRFWLLAIAVLLFLKVSEQFGHDDEEDIAHHGKDPRKYNFAALTSGAELIDYSPKNGKGFKHLLSDDRDKYALFSCYEKKWVIIGLSEDVLIESIVIASYERYSSIVKDFQILAAVSFPQSNWIYLGNYTAEARLGEQVFHVLQPSNLHTRFVKIRFFNHNFNEDLCTMSQIKVYGKTIYETIKTGMETMFTEDANKAQYEDEVEDFHSPNDTVIDSFSQENLQGSRADESNSVDSEVSGSANSTKDHSDINEEQNSPNQDEGRSSELSRDAVNSDSENLAAANETASKDDLIQTPEDNSETNTNNNDTGDSGKGKDQDNLTSNDSVNTVVESSSAVFDTDSRRKSFNDAEWKLISDAFNRFNVTEPLYAKMIRRVSEFFINPLNPFGKALNRSNLDTFFADLNDGAHIANEQRETHLQPLETVTAIDSQETPSTEQKNGGSPEETINEEKSEKAEGVPPSVAGDTNDSDIIGSTSFEDKSKIHPDTSAPPQNGESKDNSSSETSLSTNIADASPAAPTTVESTVDIKSSSLSSEIKENVSTTSASSGNGAISDNKSSVQKVPIPEISDASAISIVAGTVPNQPIDCLSVLKFAEFRKKRLKEEKENNGNQSENDKTNVFNKLFIRIKSIETNEDIIGYFFDEVVKCFQSETQMMKSNMDFMNKELSLLQEKMIEMNKIILDQQEIQQAEEQRQKERREKWQEQFFLHPSDTATTSPPIESSQKVPPSSSHGLTLAPFSTSKEDEDYYRQYFQQLFAASNDSKVQITSSNTPSAAFRSSFQKGFAGFLKSLIHNTIQLFQSSPLTSEEDHVVESLSNVWSKLYTWSHFHTSDMMIIMMMLMGLVVIMMMSLSLLLIIWLIFSQRK